MLAVSCAGHSVPGLSAVCCMQILSQRALLHTCREGSAGPAKCHRHRSALPCRHSASDPHGHQMSVRWRLSGTDDHAPWPHDVPPTTWELMHKLGAPDISACTHSFHIEPITLIEVRRAGAGPIGGRYLRSMAA